MEFHEINSMEIFDVMSWNFPWNSIEFHKFHQPQIPNFMEFHGKVHGIQWNSMEFHFHEKFSGILWIFPWKYNAKNPSNVSEKFHGIP
jgi:hypothetical protein